jgi:hypothetical protein
MRFLCLGFSVFGLSCLEPTEILLTLQTNVPCHEIRAFAYSFSLPIEIDSALAAKRIDAANPKFSCESGAQGNILGTVAIVPSKRGVQEIALRASLRFNADGIDERTGHACVAGRPGCIVQDAVVSYVASRTARFSMFLNNSCAKVVCPGGLTCFSEASCQDTRVSVACANASCESSTASIDTPRFPVTDAGYILDSGSPDAGISDAGSVDAGPIRVVGRNTIGANSDTNNRNYLSATRVVSGHSGTSNAILVYVRQVDTNSAYRQFQMAIYADDNLTPGILLGASAASVLRSDAWNSIPLAVSVNAGAAYWLAYNTDATNEAVNNFATDSVPGSKSVWVKWPFGTYPHQFPGVLDGENTDLYSMYLELAP